MNPKRISVLLVGLFLVSFALPACSPKDPFPLAMPGQYQFSTKMNIKFTDASRDDREVGLYVWYPAVLPLPMPNPANTILMPNQIAALHLTQ